MGKALAFLSAHYFWQNKVNPMKYILSFLALIFSFGKIQASESICDKIEDKPKIHVALYSQCSDEEIAMAKDCHKREYDEHKIHISSKPIKLNAIDLFILQNWSGPHKLAIELSEKSRCDFEKLMEKQPLQKMALSIKDEIVFSGTFSANLENEVLVLPMPKSWSIEEIQSICHFQGIDCLPKRFLISDSNYKKIFLAKDLYPAKSHMEYSRVWLTFSPKITNLNGLELKLAKAEKEFIFGYQEKEKSSSKKVVELAGLGKFKREDLIPLNMLSTVEELRKEIEIAFAIKSCNKTVEAYYKNVNLLLPQHFYSRVLSKDLHLFSLNASHALCEKVGKKSCTDYIESTSTKFNSENCKDYISSYILAQLQNDEDLKTAVSQCLVEKKATVCHNLGFVLSSHSLNKEALIYYGQACNLGYIPSCINGGLVSEELQEFSQAELLYGKACQEENPTSCFAQSKILIRMGNSEKAKLKSLKGCELKQGAACSLYGTFLEQDKDEAGAMAFYQKSCLASDPHGCLNLGRLNLRQDKRKPAKVAFEKSCQLKHNDGCLALASYYFLQEDYVSALKRFNKLCQESMPDACFYSGKIYAHEKKNSEALKFLEKSFELGKRVDERILFEDSYFKFLRKDKNFQDLVEKYQRSN
jgi:TPR repeat protein